MKSSANSFIISYIMAGFAAMMIALFPALPAFAFHPLITDDTGTQGKGNVEVEMAIQHEHDSYRSFDRSFESVINGIWGPVHTRDDVNEAAMTLSYGIIDPLDVVIGIPYRHARTKERRTVYGPGDNQGLSYKSTSTAAGTGDLLVEFKWNFFDHNGLTLALKPGATFPIGNEDEGLGTGRISPYLYFILTHETEYVLTHLNLGYVRNQNNQNERADIWHASLAFEFWAVKNYLRFVINGGMERNPDKRSNLLDLFVLAGVVASPSPDFDIDLGFKYSVAPWGIESPGPDYSIMGGMTFRFGPANAANAGPAVKK